MSDFHERLVAADPARGATYVQRDAEAMVSRIVAQYPIRRRSLLRDFKLKMASAVTLATLVTVGGIAALDAAGPGIAVLAIGGTHQSHSSLPGATSMMKIYEQFRFTAGPGLSAGSSSANAYQLRLAASGSAEASRVAAIFALSGPPVDANGDDSYWTVTDAAGSSVTYNNFGGVPQWNFSTNAKYAGSVSSTPGATGTSATGSTSSTPPDPVSAATTSTIEAAAQQYLAKLGYGYQVVNPQVTSSSVSVGSNGTNQFSLTYDVAVKGTLTDQSVQFTFDTNLQVIDATGPAFGVSSALVYPLQSEVAGVAVLNADQQSSFATGGGLPLAGSGAVTPMTSNTTPTPTGGSTSAPTSAADTVPPTSSDPSAPTGPPIVNVTLDSATVHLQSYSLTNGTEWLLPIFDYSGTVTNADATTSTSTWTTLAIDPAYVHLSVKTNPIAY